MALSNSDIRRLRLAGFTSYEIGELNKAQYADGSPQEIDLNARAWRATLQSRRQYIRTLLKRGITKRQITQYINNYYKKPKRSPFDFLKMEYRPPKRLTDFQAAMKWRKSIAIKRRFGSKYGTKR